MYVNTFAIVALTVPLTCIQHTTFHENAHGQPTFSNSHYIHEKHQFPKDINKQTNKQYEIQTRSQRVAFFLLLEHPSTFVVTSSKLLSSHFRRQTWKTSLIKDYHHQSSTYRFSITTRDTCHSVSFHFTHKTVSVTHHTIPVPVVLWWRVDCHVPRQIIFFHPFSFSCTSDMLRFS